ncbi:MAG TPA: class I SAM-dependent methyltransferase [Terriglobia bacterium]|nr:class I SAM-dependent methyltransferase [Terriglobia bacterium]
MKGYQPSHRNFSFSVELPANLAHMKGSSFIICRAPLESLLARIVTESEGVQARHALTPLRRTPHFAFLEGQRASYQAYLERHGLTVGYGAEHSVEAFDRLLSEPGAYLAPPYQSSYIICEAVDTPSGKQAVILDGVHRAARLLHEGVRSVPVAILTPGALSSQMQLRRYVTDFKDDFQEWYTPLDIQGIVIHERTYPEFKERPEFLRNRQRGRSKWEFIIEKNLPDVRGKSVCDIGCNSGLFSLYMAQRGANRVVGYDRLETAVQPTNTDLPRQNVVEQAYFVRNLFRLAGQPGTESVEFVACDLAQLDFSSLQHDVFFSCCVLYHFGELFAEAIRAIHLRIPEVFLQTNLGHKEPSLARYASLDYHRTLLEKYGYTVSIDAPEGYDYPVIRGTKTL